MTEQSDGLRLAPSDAQPHTAAKASVRETESTIRWQSYISGFRPSFGVDTIYDFALAYGLTVEAVAEHKGWLRKTVTFTVRGPRSRVEGMQRALVIALEEYNSRV